MKIDRWRGYLSTSANLDAAFANLHGTIMWSLLLKTTVLLPSCCRQSSCGQMCGHHRNVLLIAIASSLISRLSTTTIIAHVAAFTNESQRLFCCTSTSTIESLTLDLSLVWLGFCWYCGCQLWMPSKLDIMSYIVVSRLADVHALKQASNSRVWIFRLLWSHHSHDHWSST